MFTAEKIRLFYISVVILGALWCFQEGWSMDGCEIVYFPDAAVDQNNLQAPVVAWNSEQGTKGGVIALVSGSLIRTSQYIDGASQDLVMPSVTTNEKEVVLSDVDFISLRSNMGNELLAGVSEGRLVVGFRPRQVESGPDPRASSQRDKNFIVKEYPLGLMADYERIKRVAWAPAPVSDNPFSRAPKSYMLYVITTSWRVLLLKVREPIRSADNPAEDEIKIESITETAALTTDDIALNPLSATYQIRSTAKEVSLWGFGKIIDGQVVEYPEGFTVQSIYTQAPSQRQLRMNDLRILAVGKRDNKNVLLTWDAASQWQDMAIISDTDRVLDLTVETTRQGERVALTIVRSNPDETLSYAVIFKKLPTVP